jgi:hypothetical protein
LIHQLKTDLEQKNELDLKLTKLESSIVNSVTTMHNQEKEDMFHISVIVFQEGFTG